MIHNIIHISDIHIRSGDSKKARYDEYISVFNNLAESVAEQSSILNKSAVIVITGDIFHDKNRIGPSGLEAATYLLQKLAPLATVIIIRGNHDYRQDHPCEHDMISALVSYNIPNVIYFDRTDVHKFQNIYFGLTAIQDTLLYGSTSGIANNLPPFPVVNSVTGCTDVGTYKVALFHGTINGCTLQNGSKTTRDGYPIDWFKGYDAILLGDIHLQQVSRASIIDNTSCTLPHTSICQTYSYNDQIPWGYSGSLLQQDFGETIKGHGYVLWNLHDKSIHVFHIKNNYGMIKIHFNGNVDELEIEHKQYIKPITRMAALHKIITTKWFPDKLHIRVFGDNITAEDLRSISHKIQSYGKTVLTITKKILNKNTPQLTTDTQKDSPDILSINSTDSLIEFIQNKLVTDNKQLSSDKWKQWILHPETLLIPLEYIPDNIASKLKSKANIIEKSAKEYIDEFEKIQTQQIITGNLILHKLEWNWVLNYKNNNVFDFDKNTKNISVINAKNGNGKSNFFEIICIALFGEGFPSRHNTNYSSTIICDKKPAGIMASTRITFSLNDARFILERTMRHNTSKRTIKFEDVTLYSVVDDTNSIMHQKDGAVSAWIDLNIGKCSTYLMSTMLTQSADSDFFSLDHKSQRELLDRVLSLDHINSLKKLLKDATLYYKYAIESIEIYYAGQTHRDVYVVDQKHIDNLAKYKNDLDLINQSIHDNNHKWNMCSEKDLYVVHDIQSLHSRISQLQTTIKSLPLHTIEYLTSKIVETANSIKTTENELSKFHSFSDLDPVRGGVSMCGGILEHISHHLLNLQQHPFYKGYNIYEDISIIHKMINTTHKNNDDNSDLIKIIYDFETWNRLQTELFDRDRTYFENESELQKLHDKINLLIVSIQQFPDKIVTCRKKLDKLRKIGSKLAKDKDMCLDKKPNKPTKDKKWLDSVNAHILEYGDLDEHLAIKQFIVSSIRQIPIVCNNIQSGVQKIAEYERYIQECADYHFNNECWACKKQPWKSKYDTIYNTLPTLKTDVTTLESELAALQYDGVDCELIFSDYKPYMTELEEYLEIISGHITDIKLYIIDIKSWNDSHEWTAEYDTVKLQYDTAMNDISQCDSEKNNLESNYEKARLEKLQLQTRHENIMSKKHEYELYLGQKGTRDASKNEAQYKLEYNWFNTLYSYRTSISSFVKHNNTLMASEHLKKAEFEQLLTMVEERDRCSKELVALNAVYEAYPFWQECKKLEASRIQTTRMINELEVIIKGTHITALGTGDTQMLKCLELLSTFKLDNHDIIYISDAFIGYREWLYINSIGPIIQNKVNGILEMMCDDRPLYVDCEWLDKIETVSWFIRDGESRVIIQKASGFQRFIIGIAMRVAINQIGLSRIRFNELFIDEGFTACDADNLERVPEFLRGLLRFYSSIYLATHLEDIKGCADKQILIKRDATGLSQIQYGDPEMILEVEDAAKGKKKGRPTKNSIIVTKV